MKRSKFSEAQIALGIEIHQLRYAVATAVAKSFSRAAAALNVKQITLSRRVQQLEDRLGVKLFERSTRGAEITENGRPFIEQACRIITDLDNLRTTARNVSYGLQGRIAVGFCSPLMAGNLRLAISEYLTRFEDVQFDGVEAGLEKLFHGLHSHTIDVFIASSRQPDRHPHRERLHRMRACRQPDPESARQARSRTT